MTEFKVKNAIGRASARPPPPGARRLPGHDGVDPAAGALGFLQSREVLFEDGLIQDAVLQTFEVGDESGSLFPGERIDHPVLVTVRFDQAVSFHPGQVLGDLGLGTAEDFLKMADAERALRDKIKNPEPGFVTKTLVDLNEFQATNIYI